MSKVVLSIPRLGWRDQAFNQLAGCGRDFFDCMLKGDLVGARRNREATEFSYELQRRVADLQLGRGRFEVEEGLDASAHGRRVFEMPEVRVNRISRV